MRRSGWAVLVGAALWVAPASLPQSTPPAPPQGAAPQVPQRPRPRFAGAGVEEMVRFNRLLIEARGRLQGSLVRLEPEFPEETIQARGERPPVTGVVVRPDVIVTTQDAVQGAQAVFADLLGEDPRYSALLEVLGFHRGVAVLQWVVPGPGAARPIRPGSSLEAPHGSLVLLLDAGTPEWPGVAQPAALVKSASLRRSGPEEEGRPMPLLRLKGPAFGPEDQGGLVADIAGRMLGILKSGSRPFMYLPAEGPRVVRPPESGPHQLERVQIFAVSRGAQFAEVIPVELVLEAVEKTLSNPPGMRLARPRLGISVYKDSLIVARVLFGSPALRSGVLKGDRITGLDRQAVNDASDLSRLLGENPQPGRRIELEVERKRDDGPARLCLTLVLDELEPGKPNK